MPLLAALDAQRRSALALTLSTGGWLNSAAASGSLRRSTAGSAAPGPGWGAGTHAPSAGVDSKRRTSVV